MAGRPFVLSRAERALVQSWRLGNIDTATLWRKLGVNAGLVFVAEDIPLTYVKPTTHYTARRVYLDSGGYALGTWRGRYFGTGSPVYYVEYWNEDRHRTEFTRAASYKHLREWVESVLPGIKFVRHSPY